jgi:membrane protease YdiL (CAAX protease family)
MSILPWIHILVAYLIYVLIALLTSIIIRGTVGDLKDFSVRNSPRVLVLGGMANLIAMTAILALLVFWDGRPIAALGLGFRSKDALAGFGGLAVTFLLAIVFLLFLKRTQRIKTLDVARPAGSFSQGVSMSIGLVVLVTIVLQEEVLNRGYVVLNLLPLGPVGLVLTSTFIFVLIHLLTNRANIYQIISWVVSGLVLVTSYLLSGSIWVPVILHYATDAMNTLVFGITGQYSFFRISPSMTDGQRAAFRVVYAFVMLLLLVSIYGVRSSFLGQG